MCTICDDVQLKPENGCVLPVSNSKKDQLCGKSVKNKTENIDNTSGNGKTLKKIIRKANEFHNFFVLKIKFLSDITVQLSIFPELVTNRNNLEP